MLFNVHNSNYYESYFHRLRPGALRYLNCRGFTSWSQVSGRGSNDGEPHYGSHAWPSLASAVITMVDDNRVESVLARLREFNDDRPKLGLRAFVWNIEDSI